MLHSNFIQTITRIIHTRHAQEFLKNCAYDACIRSREKEASSASANARFDKRRALCGCATCMASTRTQNTYIF